MSQFRVGDKIQLASKKELISRGWIEEKFSEWKHPDSPDSIYYYMFKKGVVTIIDIEQYRYWDSNKEYHRFITRYRIDENYRTIYDDLMIVSTLSKKIERCLKL
jgi:hypothetical protein